jgi:GTP cyclohydrolase I
LLLNDKKEFQDEIGDNHVSLSAKKSRDAFDLSDDEKIEKIKKDVESILSTLGMDLTDDSLKGTKSCSKNVCKEILEV